MRPCPVCALPADSPCSSCTQDFCQRHLFDCPDCHLSLCGSCFDSHNLEGHWSDSDTAAALAACSSSLAIDHVPPAGDNNHTSSAAPAALAVTKPSSAQLHKAATAPKLVVHRISPPSLPSLATAPSFLFHRVSRPPFTSLATAHNPVFHRIIPPPLTSLATATRLLFHRVSQSALSAFNRLLLRLKLPPLCLSGSRFSAIAAEAGQ